MRVVTLIILVALSIGIGSCLNNQGSDDSHPTVEELQQLAGQAAEKYYEDNPHGDWSTTEEASDLREAIQKAMLREKCEEAEKTNASDA
ncbi:hypothetical protein JW859_06625 [bacterium]|nr:hypothetical protein [bacterium]